MKLSSAIALLSLSGAAAFAPSASQKASSALFASDMNRNVRSPGQVNSPNSVSFGNRNNNQSLSRRNDERDGYNSQPIASRQDGDLIDRAWDQASVETVQGGSLRTWSFMSPSVERIQVLLKTNGRPLNADIELWQGPDNTPQKMAVYLEDGDNRPFSAVVESPRGSNTMAIRNTAQMEFPLEASVEPAIRGGNTPVLANFHQRIVEKRGRTIQGGAIVTFPFDPTVQKVAICMKTDGRPLNSRIELLQGPNNNKQVVEVYCEDGYDRPFVMIVDTPGVGNVVRIINTATVEFPLTASVDPFLVEDMVGDMPSGRSMQSQGNGRQGQDDFFFSRR